MTRLIARGLGAFAAAAALAVLVAVIYSSNHPGEAPQLPVPNGFGDFLQAAQQLRGDYSDLKALNGEELQSTVTKDAIAVQHAKLGFSRECRVPLPVSSADWSNRSPDLIAIKRMAGAFVAEGKLAEIQGRPIEAAEAYLDVVRLAHESTRGGIIIHGLVGVAIEAMGQTRLEKVLPTLDAKGCRLAAMELEGIELRRETPETMIRNERIWVRRACGIREQVQDLLNIRQRQSLDQNFTGRANGQAIRSRQLLIELASRAFQLERGERPGQLGDLVPGYLKSFPQDPVTGTNLVYRP